MAICGRPAGSRTSSQPKGSNANPILSDGESCRRRAIARKVLRSPIIQRPPSNHPGRKGDATSKAELGSMPSTYRARYSTTRANRVRPGHFRRHTEPRGRKRNPTAEFAEGRRRRMNGEPTNGRGIRNAATKAHVFHPSSFILHPSSFILLPSAVTLSWRNAGTVPAERRSPWLSGARLTVLHADGHKRAAERAHGDGAACRDGRR